LEIPEILIEFLDLIKKKNSQLNISNKEYNNSMIEREKGRIDISVKDLSTKKAIIIENKINNALDTERQLPKYKEYLERNGYTTEAIVYLSLDGNKIPNKGDWSIEEKNELYKKLVLIGAYNETDCDIYSMLQSCENLITDIDVLLLIRQYKQLIKFLGRNNMNKPIMKQFFETVLNVDNFETANTISDMLQDLGKYRAVRLKDKFGDNPSPFEKIDIWRDSTAYFDKLFSGNSNFAIDISCDIDKYSVQFFDRNSKDNQSAIDFISDLECDFIERENNPRLFKFFQFPQEENEVYEFIKEFKEKLKNKINKPSCQ